MSTQQPSASSSRAALGGGGGGSRRTPSLLTASIDSSMFGGKRRNSTAGAASTLPPVSSSHHRAMTGSAMDNSRAVLPTHHRDNNNINASAHGGDDAYGRSSNHNYDHGLAVAAAGDDGEGEATHGHHFDPYAARQMLVATPPPPPAARGAGDHPQHYHEQHQQHLNNSIQQHEQPNAAAYHYGGALGDHGAGGAGGGADNNSTHTGNNSHHTNHHQQQQHHHYGATLGGSVQQLSSSAHNYTNGNVIANNNHHNFSSNTSTHGGGGGGGDNVFRALFEAAAKVGLSHTELEGVVHGLSTLVTQQGAAIEALRRENSILSDRLEGYLAVASAVQEQSAAREASVARQQGREEAGDKAAVLFSELSQQTQAAVSEGKSRESKFEQMITNAALHAQRLDEQVGYLNVEMRGGMVEVMKRVSRLLQQTGTFNARQLKARSDAAVGARYFQRWSRYAKVRANTAVMVSDSAFMLAKRFFATWARYRNRQVSTRIELARMLRGNVTGFLLRQFHQWHAYAVRRRAERGGRLTYRGHAFNQLAARTQTTVRGTIFHQWMAMALARRRERHRAQLVNTIGLNIVADRRRRAFALWALFARITTRRRQSLRALQRSNLSLMARAFFQKWVQFAQRGQMAARVEAATAPLRRQVVSLTNEVSELKHMLYALMERHEGLGSVVETVAKTKLAAKAVKPSALVTEPSPSRTASTRGVSAEHPSPPRADGGLHSVHEGGDGAGRSPPSAGAGEEHRGHLRQGSSAAACTPASSYTRGGGGGGEGLGASMGAMTSPSVVAERLARRPSLDAQPIRRHSAAQSGVGPGGGSGGLTQQQLAQHQGLPSSARGVDGVVGAVSPQRSSASLGAGGGVAGSDILLSAPRAGVGATRVGTTAAPARRTDSDVFPARFAQQQQFLQQWPGVDPLRSAIDDTLQHYSHHSQHKGAPGGTAQSLAMDSVGTNGVVIYRPMTREVVSGGSTGPLPSSSDPINTSGGFLMKSVSSVSGGAVVPIPSPQRPFVPPPPSATHPNSAAHSAAGSVAPTVGGGTPRPFIVGVGLGASRTSLPGGGGAGAFVSLEQNPPLPLRSGSSSNTTTVATNTRVHTTVANTPLHLEQSYKDGRAIESAAAAAEGGGGSLDGSPNRPVYGGGAGGSVRGGSVALSSSSIGAGGSAVGLLSRSHHEGRLTPNSPPTVANAGVPTS